MNENLRQIGVMIERSRSYGRQLCEGIAAYAAKHRAWRLTPLNGADIATPRALAPFDGFICRFLDTDVPRRFRATRKPVVDVYHDRPLKGIAAVDSDHEGIGRAAAEHFLDRRFTAFAFCGHNGSGYSDARYRGYAETLKAAGASCLKYETPKNVRYRFDRLTIFSDPTQDEGDRENLRRWVAALPKPIAVFCSHDFRAYQLSQACAAEGLAIPDDVAILGVDNDTLLCSFTPSPISSVDPDAPAVGYAAAERLDRMLDGMRDDLAPRYVPCRGVVARMSTEIYPLTPAWLSDALVFIRRNIGSTELSSAQVCRHVGLSHTVVVRHFQKALGTTIRQEIRRTRLNLARQLIETEGASPSEAAHRTGFASLQYFSNCYTEAFGRRPSATGNPRNGAQKNVI